MCGEVQVQEGVCPASQVGGEGEGHGGHWGAVLTWTSCFCGFAAQHLVMVLGLPLANRVTLDRLPRHRMKENEGKLEPTNVSGLLSRDYCHSKISGCCFTSASKSHVNSSSVSFNAESYREGILEKKKFQLR